MSRFQRITKAPGVNFTNIHPTVSAGRKFKGDDLPPWAGTTGKESDYISCKQCGYFFDRTKHPSGSGWGNESATSTSQTHPITGVTLYYADPIVGAGCPLCGSSEYE